MIEYTYIFINIVNPSKCTRNNIYAYVFNVFVTCTPFFNKKNDNYRDQNVSLLP